VAEFGADTDVAMLDSEPDRNSGWFAYVWGACSAKTFNIRLTARGSAFGYWRERDWLGGDPLIAARALADALNLSARDALGLVVVLRQDPHWRQQFRKQLTDD